MNSPDADAVIRPVIEFAPLGADGWTAVPATDPVKGVPFYTSANVRRGETAGTSAMGIAQLRLLASSDPLGVPAQGVVHSGVNPGPAVTIASHTYTELSFTIRATDDAPWLASYTVRLSDASGAFALAGAASLTMRSQPPVLLSPGQRSGVDVAQSFPRYPLNPPSSTTIAPIKGSGPVVTALGPPYTSPHTNYTLTSDACAACHATHRAQSGPLLIRPVPQSALCFTCHNGTGAESNIAAQYGDPLVPPNNASTDSYYSHPATSLSSHTSDRDPTEFAGVLNRHTACADCHQPHNADAGLATETGNGWTASGALKAAAGVEVTYGLLVTDSPTYTLKTTSTYEYQLCFKCHSGFTQLNPQSGPPSTWALDKAVEFNPLNPSYHPIEAPGKNGTTRMTNSLGGTSPYKLWTFTTGQTVRCVSCHGDSRLGNPASPPPAGDRLAPHAVQYRGMLIENLRDRQLKDPSEAYNAEDFALCYVCHAEAPFVDTSQGPRLDSNFPLHGYHTAAIASFTGPAGETVDQDGAGHGNALCAECHFRTHSTAYPVDGQASNSRLVNFAPDVKPYQGTEVGFAGKLQFVAATQSCTLTCHGVNHKGWSY